MRSPRQIEPNQLVARMHAAKACVERYLSLRFERRTADLPQPPADLTPPHRYFWLDARPVSRHNSSVLSIRQVRQPHRIADTAHSRPAVPAGNRMEIRTPG